MPWLVSYAVGTLLGVALLDLLPEALESLEPTPVFGTLLGGILAFFIFEKFLMWRHCHHDHCDVHQAAAPLILIGDAVHNFIDGAVIAAATYISVPLGVDDRAGGRRPRDSRRKSATSPSCSARATRRVRALWLNVLSGMSAVAGVLVAGVTVDRVPLLLPYFLPMAAASFLYVAMSDLIPSLHRGPFEKRRAAPGARGRSRASSRSSCSDRDDAVTAPASPSSTARAAGLSGGHTGVLAKGQACVRTAPHRQDRARFPTPSLARPLRLSAGRGA